MSLDEHCFTCRFRIFEPVDPLGRAMYCRKFGRSCREVRNDDQECGPEAGHHKPKLN